MTETISTTEQTPEAVAYKLMSYILRIEGKQPDRELILSTYSVCLRATKGLYETKEEKEAFSRLNTRNREMA